MCLETDTPTPREVLQLRLAVGEREFLRREAAALGVSVSALVRERIGLPPARLGRPPKATP